MAIIEGELLEYKALNNVDGAAGTNGGRMSANAITSDVNQNVFPNATKSQLLAGLTQYRKVFHKVANDDDEALSNCRIYMTQIALGDDYTTLIEGTQTDVESGISGREYGVGSLKTSLSGGETSFIAVLENSGLNIFQNADMIVLTDGTNTEYFDNVTINKSGSEVTITLDGSDTVANSYSNTNTYIGSVIEAGTVETSFDNWVETAAGSGTYDETTHPPEQDNIGTIEQEWTLTFSDASNFTVVGDTEGSVGAGTIGSDFAPINPNFTKPYFVLRSSGFGGTWQAGDTIVWETHPSSVPVWRKKIIPAGSSQLAIDSYKVETYGETA